MSKLFRFRTLVLVALVITLTIIAMIYALGGLKVNLLSNDLTPFSEEGFVLPEVLDENKLVAQNDRFDMYFDETNTAITIYDKFNLDDNNDPVVYTTVKTGNNVANTLRNPFTLSYFAEDGSQKVLSAYDNSISYKDELTNTVTRYYKFKYDEANNSVQVYYELGRFGVTSDWFPEKLTAERFQKLFVGNLQSEECLAADAALEAGEITQYERDDLCYQNPFLTGGDRSFIRNTYQLEDDGGYRRGGNTQLIKQRLYQLLYEKGYQPFDEEGRPLWETDDDGEFLLDENEQRIPVNAKYTREDVAYDNGFWGIETEVSSPRFLIAIEFRLTSEGFQAKIIHNSIKEGQDFETPTAYRISRIDMLPNFTSSTEYITPPSGEDPGVKSSGFIVVPDGSGALINFNNDKGSLNYPVYDRPIYGPDLTYVPETMREELQSLMFPMYGFVDTSRKQGVLAIVEQGAANSNIFADTPRSNSNFNRANFKSSFRFSESVSVGTGWNEKAFIMWTKDKAPLDYIYRYDILNQDEMTYVGVANAYRTYLTDKYNLTEKDQTTTTVLNANMIGAFERYQLFLGIRYMADASLTTFEQAKEIIAELNEIGVNNIALGYTGWTQDGLEPQARNNIKASKVLGGNSGFLELQEYLNENNIPFYPETFVSTNKGYDYAFGKMKYTARTISAEYTEYFPYNPATLLQDKTKDPLYFVSPRFFENITRNIINEYQKLNIESIMVSDLGRFNYGDYAKSANIHLELGNLYQERALRDLEQVYAMQLRAPFDYALQFASQAIDVPLTSSLYGIFDASIPFYQLVVSGLVDYAGVSINKNFEKGKDWYLLKSIETGSNIFFELSYEDSKVLLETEYTQYYYTYYRNWLAEIQEMTQTLDTLGIHEGKLVSHEIIETDVVKVTYSTGLEIVINYRLNPYTYGTITVQPNTYQVV